MKKSSYIPKVGDKVMYSREFLRNICAYTGDICFVIGTVTNVEQWPEFVLVSLCWTDYSPAWPKSFTREWQGEHVKVLACNLEPSPFK